MKDKWSHPGRRLTTAALWLMERPLLLVVLAHSVFSIGIWNARDGYWEETTPVVHATRALQGQRPDASLYVNLLALTLRYLTPDPVGALTFIKYGSSLLATVALCLTLNCFKPFLKQGGIILACFVWIASSLNAPYLQSSSLSLFTFAIMLLGIYCLLRSESLIGLIGFYLFGVAAALMRPEYYFPVALVTLIVLALLIWRGARAIRARLRVNAFWTIGAAIGLLVTGTVLLLANPPAALVKKTAELDKYALFGLGQCYAEFYRRNHPEEIFSPMTEYKALLNRTFKQPESFVSAIRNNPGEAFNYFYRNAARNLFQRVPNALVDRYRDQSEAGNNSFTWIVRGIFIVGGLAGAWRLYRERSIFWAFFSNLKCGLGRSQSLSRKFFLLLGLVSTSSLAIILLVGTPRYFLPWVPLFYLYVAFCSDSLLSFLRVGRFEPWVIGGSAIFYCSPNFLEPRLNFEMDSVQHVAPFVRERPRIAAWWADPNVVLGLGGKAEAVNSADGIKQADIENGRIDILLVEGNLRGTQTWTSQIEFFEGFVSQPERYGYKKLIEFPTGRFDVYYRPVAP